MEALICSSMRCLLPDMQRAANARWWLANASSVGFVVSKSASRVRIYGLASVVSKKLNLIM
jgi:hypothetical protein